MIDTKRFAIAWLVLWGAFVVSIASAIATPVTENKAPAMSEILLGQLEELSVIHDINSGVWDVTNVALVSEPGAVVKTGHLPRSTILSQSGN
jgi:hypothetical protein